MERRRRRHQRQWSGAVGQDVQDVTADQSASPANPPVKPLDTSASTPPVTYPTRRAGLPSLRELRPAPLRPVGPSAHPAQHPSPFATSIPSQRRRPPARSHRSRRRRLLLPSLITFALLMALFGGALWLLDAPQWQVHTVRIVGTSDPVVIRAIQRMPLANCDIFRCDTATLAQRVEATPLVAHAQVTPSYPNTLVVSVQLRLSALLWQSGAASSATGGIVVASDGVALGSPASDPAFARAPLTTVIETGSGGLIAQNLGAHGRMDPAIVTMATELREGNRQVFGGAGIVRYDDSTGFTLTAPGGLQVIFGTPADAVATWDDVTAPSSAPGDPGVTGVAASPAPEAIKRAVALQVVELRGMLAYLARQGRQAAVIDLRWGAHPYYRLAGA